MKNRLPIAISVAALVVALLGATGLAQAVQSATVPFAANAGKLRGFAPSKTSKKNTVVVRGANGKIDARSLPASASGPRGSQGPTGAQGPKGDRGPSFGDGKQLSNMTSIPCGQDVVVGSQTVTVTEPSRIWIHGHGSLRDNGSNATEFGLWLRLRNAGDTATLAVSTRAWDATSDGMDTVFALSSGGLLLSGSDPDAPAPAFVASPGSYILQLAVVAGGGSGCTAVSLPGFGWNQGNGMGYMLVGTG